MVYWAGNWCIMENSDMDENPKTKKRGRRRLIGLAGSLISIAILTYIAISLITGNQSGLFSFFGLFSGTEPVEVADEYHFDVGRNRVFADLGGSLTAAGTLGIQVLDAAGNETLRDSFRMVYPALSAVGGYAIAFDIGGTSVRVYDKADMIASFETSGVIVSASINKNGWFSVCTHGDGTSTGVITAYNNKGRETYRVFLTTGYALSAILSPDNKSIAILNLTEGGSRITYYNLNSVEADRVFDLPGGLIIDIRFLENGDMLVISTESLFVANKKNEIKELYDFSGKHLSSYSLDGGYLMLYLLDSGVGYRGRLVTMNEDGSIIGEIETNKETISISAGVDYLAVLRNDRMVIYSSELEELEVSGKSANAVGAVNALAIGGGAAIAAGDHSAVVVRTVGNE